MLNVCLKLILFYHFHMYERRKHKVAEQHFILVTCEKQYGQLNFPVARAQMTDI